MLLGFMVIPAHLFMPNPGDILCIINGDAGTIHRLNGPYERDVIQEVLDAWANEYMECGMQFAFYWEPLDDGEPVTGETVVMHRHHLN